MGHPNRPPIKKGTNLLFFNIVSKHSTQDDAEAWAFATGVEERYGYLNTRQFGWWVYDRETSVAELVNIPPKGDGVRRYANLRIVNVSNAKQDKVWFGVSAKGGIHHGSRLWGSYGASSSHHKVLFKVMRKQRVLSEGKEARNKLRPRSSIACARQAKVAKRERVHNHTANARAGWGK
jgi:hypothetical protein